MASGKSILIALGTAAAAATCAQAWDFDKTCYDLMAGQTLNVGSVCAELDTAGENLLVNYEISEAGWVITETHLWVGTDPDAAPQTRKGNPKIGNFPYSDTELSVTSFGPYSIALADINVDNADDCTPGAEQDIFWAAHAVVSNGETGDSETAWSTGTRFVPKGSWATYSQVTFTCPEDDLGGGDGDGVGDDGLWCEAFNGETAYAMIPESSTSFCDDGFDRWGWRHDIEAGNSYTFDIYAGAGGCDTTNAALAGQLTVNWVGDDITVSVAAVDDLARFSLIHIYLGADPYPKLRGKDTTAPGQYGFQTENLLDGVPEDSEEEVAAINDIDPTWTHTFAADGATSLSFIAHFNSHICAGPAP